MALVLAEATKIAYEVAQAWSWCTEEVCTSTVEKTGSPPESVGKKG